MARGLNDTQIFKELDNYGFKLSLEEYDLLNSFGAYSYLLDAANSIWAFSFRTPQEDNEDKVNELVDKLNDICLKNGEECNWYVGDVEEDYVYLA